MTDDAPPPPPAAEWSPAWIRRRARNVYKRPLLVGGITAGCFVVTLVGLVLASHAPTGESSGAEHEFMARPRPRPDTAAIRRRLAAVEVELRAADSALAQALATSRALASARAPLSAARRARRDSLAGALATLDSLIQRSRDAPLPASYQALGAALPEEEGEDGTGSRRVAELLDTLTAIEATRSGFGAAGGVDPIFVALTARATAVGRAIQEEALERQRALRRQLSKLAAPHAPSAGESSAGSLSDTVGLAFARDSVRRELNAACRGLAAARLANQEVDERIVRTRAAAAARSSVPAMLPAALIVGLAVGLGVAFALEAREPRVADAAEARATAGIDVLATLGQNHTVQERRRRADREVPPLIELASDAYQLLHSQLAGRSFELPLVAVLGDSPMVTSVVAANLAAQSARQVRTTLLVDAGFETNSVAALARLPESPGLAGVLSGELDWAGAVSAVTVGRDRTMDVLPGGSLGGASVPEGADMEIARVLGHVARRYECVVVSMPVSRRGTIPIPASDTMPAILCVRTARTTVAGLGQIMAALRAHGASVRGLVVWDRDYPTVIASGNPDGRREPS